VPIRHLRIGERRLPWTDRSDITSNRSCPLQTTGSIGSPPSATAGVGVFPSLGKVGAFFSPILRWFLAAFQSSRFPVAISRTLLMSASSPRSSSPSACSPENLHAGVGATATPNPAFEGRRGREALELVAGHRGAPQLRRPSLAPRSIMMIRSGSVRYMRKAK